MSTAPHSSVSVVAGLFDELLPVEDQQRIGAGPEHEEAFRVMRLISAFRYQQERLQNLEWERVRADQAEGTLRAVRVLLGSEESPIERAFDLLAELKAWRRLGATPAEAEAARDALVTRVKTAEERAEAVQRELTRLVNLPMMRRQLPDGSVPFCVEAGLNGWQRAADDYHAALTVAEDRLRDLSLQLEQAQAEAAVLSELPADFRKRASETRNALSGALLEFLAQQIESRMAKAAGADVPSAPATAP